MGPLEPHQSITLVVAALTLAGVAFRRLPFVPLDRAGFALVGAAALLVTGVLDLHEASALADAEVLVLLFGLMPLNEALAEAGAFRAATRWLTGRARRPLALLAAVTLAAGGLSALFLSDTIVIMLTPPVIQLSRHLGVAPLPNLLALPTAANASSVPTVTGNPQNLIVRLQGGIDYPTFLAALAPVATAALVVSAGLLLTAGDSGRRVLARVDVSLLTMFAGLFVVVGALGHSGLTAIAAASWGAAWMHGVGPPTVVTALASNLFSNVPAVPLPSPLVAEAGGGRTGLLTLAMASTLAGNLTLVGSVANLIVVESARKLGVTVGFGAYLRVGLPITLRTLLLGALWLARVGAPG